MNFIREIMYRYGNTMRNTVKETGGGKRSGAETMRCKQVRKCTKSWLKTKISHSSLRISRLTRLSVPKPAMRFMNAEMTLLVFAMLLLGATAMQVESKWIDHNCERNWQQVPILHSHQIALVIKNCAGQEPEVLPKIMSQLRCGWCDRCLKPFMVFENDEEKRRFCLAEDEFIKAAITEDFYGCACCQYGNDGKVICKECCHTIPATGPFKVIQPLQEADYSTPEASRNTWRAAMEAFHGCELVTVEAEINWSETVGIRSRILWEIMEAKRKGLAAQPQSSDAPAPLHASPDMAAALRNTDRQPASGTGTKKPTSAVDSSEAPAPLHAPPTMAL